jgi:hypothetical protein
MGSASSNIISISLAGIVAREDIQSAAQLLSGSMNAFLPPANPSIESMQSAATVVSGLFTSVDPFFNEVSLLLPCDGSNGSTSFPDASSVANVMTSTGIVVDTASPLFGTGAANYGNTATANKLTCPITLGGPLDLGLSYTIEGWFKYNPNGLSAPGGAIISDYAGGSPKWLLEFAGVIPTLSINFLVNFTGGVGQYNVSSPSFTVDDTTWHAFAAVMDAGVMTCYLDGVGSSIPTTTHGAPIATSGILTLGDAGFSTAGIIQVDEVRISTFARYTANYTPAVAPFPTS